MRELMPRHFAPPSWKLSADRLFVGPARTDASNQESPRGASLRLVIVARDSGDGLFQKEDVTLDAGRREVRQSGN
jgi:hypothetical protein